MTEPTSLPVYELLDAAATAVVVVDGDGVVRHANPRMAEVFGHEPTELVGRPVALVVPGGRIEAMLGATGTGTRTDLTGRRRDGREFAAEVTVTPLATPWGSWLIASFVDVTQRHEAEHRVRDQSRSYLMLARINEAVATAEDPVSLFRKVCDVAAVDGGFSGAWVVAPGPSAALEVLASAGALATELAVVGRDSADGAALVSGRLEVLRGADSRVPGGFRMATDVPLFLDDVAPGGTGDGAVVVRSAAALPLRSRGRTVATLDLYADRPGAFEPDLRELPNGDVEGTPAQLLALSAIEAIAESEEEE